MAVRMKSFCINGLRKATLGPSGAPCTFRTGPRLRKLRALLEPPWHPELTAASWRRGSAFRPARPNAPDYRPASYSCIFSAQPLQLGSTSHHDFIIVFPTRILVLHRQGVERHRRPGSVVGRYPCADRPAPGLGLSTSCTSPIGAAFEGRRV